jgi:hypothetical protein
MYYDNDASSPKVLSLGQQLGLEPKAPEPLSREQWKAIEHRARQRDDTTTRPCPICREQFGTQEQVLLSCSHVFHTACLRSFERFSNSKMCPLCRQENYRRKKITDGAEAYKVKCATK